MVSILRLACAIYALALRLEKCGFVAAVLFLNKTSSSHYAHEVVQAASTEPSPQHQHASSFPYSFALSKQVDDAGEAGAASLHSPRLLVSLLRQYTFLCYANSGCPQVQERVEVPETVTITSRCGDSKEDMADVESQSNEFRAEGYGYSEDVAGEEPQLQI